MGIQRAVLLIADIGGYTNYMHWNRKHLAHAQWTVAQLLESVIDAAKGMKLAKLEGDAAFFWAPGGNTSVLVCDRPPQMRQRFRTRREQIKKDHLNRPGMSGDSSSWKGWGHVRWFIEEVPAGAA
ncbi:hypothetical protein N126_03216 [Mycobacterium tuberculosis MAL020200]|nr:hypothetical protein N126_03216 [Mycobacterium tuberculosis MAL020200]